MHKTKNQDGWLTSFTGRGTTGTLVIFDLEDDLEQIFTTFAATVAVGVLMVLVITL